MSELSFHQKKSSEYLSNKVNMHPAKHSEGLLKHRPSDRKANGTCSPYLPLFPVHMLEVARPKGSNVIKDLEQGGGSAKSQVLYQELPNCLAQRCIGSLRFPLAWPKRICSLVG